MQRSKTNRQKTWNYMRRNKVFRIGDILTVLEVSEEGLKELIRQLNHVGYIKIVSKAKKFRDRKYKLIKNTGVQCPMVVHKKKLYDRNTEQFYPLGGQKIGKVS